MKVYLGTIALEKNRWGSRIPTYAVSSIIEQARKDGFDGIELWEEHLTKVDAAEYNVLCKTDFPIIYNIYDPFSSDDITDHLRELAKAITDCGAIAVKFNLGACDKSWQQQVDLLKKWATLLPETTQLLCECHAGSALEDVEVAKQAFAQLPAPRYNIIAHTCDYQDDFDAKVGAYAERIQHIHTQTCLNGRERCCLETKTAYNTEAIAQMLTLPNVTSFTIEFTKEEDTVAALYENALRDFKFLKNELAKAQ